MSKVCPIYKAAILQIPHAWESIREGNADCDRQNCALSNDDGKCAITDISNNITSIVAAASVFLPGMVNEPGETK